MMNWWRLLPGLIPGAGFFFGVTNADGGVLSKSDNPSNIFQYLMLMVLFADLASPKVYSLLGSVGDLAWFSDVLIPSPCLGD